MADNTDIPVAMVVGSDGMIGRALVQRLRQGGGRVVCADLGDDGSEKDYYHLDLSTDLSRWKPPCPVRVAYLCAGITCLDSCRKDPEKTARINVDGTVALADKLVKQGAFVVFLSSNQVYDGSVPFAKPDMPYHPVTEYGRQKTVTEQKLKQLEDSIAIVRLTKVLGLQSIFTQWASVLKSGNKIHPFKDMSLSPIPLSTVISVLQLVGGSQCSGIWQVSGETDISYADAAEIICQHFGTGSKLIHPICVAKSEIELEANPKYTTLTIDRLKNKLGIIPPPIEWTLKNHCS